MTKLETRNNELYAGEQKVLKGWESFSGWYWFATEKTSDNYDGAPLWFGFVHGFADEWGSFSEAELNTMIARNRVWEIKDIDLPHAGRRD